jgi:hypothetical protein
MNRRDIPAEAAAVWCTRLVAEPFVVSVPAPVPAPAWTPVTVAAAVFFFAAARSWNFVITRRATAANPVIAKTAVIANPGRCCRGRCSHFRGQDAKTTASDEIKSRKKEAQAIRDAVMGMVGAPGGLDNVRSNDEL